MKKTFCNLSFRGLFVAACGVLSIIFLFYAGTVDARERVMTAKDAYVQLLAEKTISDVTIAGSFDFAELDQQAESSRNPSPFHFQRVKFKDGVVAVGVTVESDVLFNNCNFSFIRSIRTVWNGALVLEQGMVSGRSDFKDNDFKKNVSIRNLPFSGESNFEKSEFYGTVDFSDSIWESRLGLSDTFFHSALIFARSEVRNSLVFHGAIFGGDVSFLDLVVAESANFTSTIFKGDAEFRFCRITEGLFSSRKYITVFEKFADFRGSIFTNAQFDYAIARGIISFVNTEFGSGGVSFISCVFSGPLVNLDNISCKGPMQFDDLYAPALQLQWDRVAGAVSNGLEKNLTAGQGITAISILQFLENRMQSLGRRHDVLQIQAIKARTEFQATIRNPEIKIVSKIWAVIEWLLYGFPTEYGTNFGRIAQISLICWIVGSIPMIGKKGMIVRIQLKIVEQHPGGGPGGKRYQPLMLSNIPEGSFSPVSHTERILDLMRFCFSMLFKVGSRDLIYIEARPRYRSYPFELYFKILWGIGALLMVLMAWTLKNTSPLVSTLLSMF